MNNSRGGARGLGGARERGGRPDEGLAGARGSYEGAGASKTTCLFQNGYWRMRDLVPPRRLYT